MSPAMTVLFGIVAQLIGAAGSFLVGFDSAVEGASGFDFSGMLHLKNQNDSSRVVQMSTPLVGYLVVHLVFL
jgi:hypothetical protein